MYLCEPVCKRMAQKRSSGVKGIDLDGIVKVREKASGWTEPKDSHLLLVSTKSLNDGI